MDQADRHLSIFDEETRAMPLGKIKALLLKLGLFGFLFFLVKGLLWLAVLGFISVFLEHRAIDSITDLGFWSQIFYETRI